MYVPRAKLNHNQALIKALLVLDFGIGVRFPSKAWTLRLRDYDADRHVLVVTEPKKNGRRRTLLIEPEWLCCSPRHPSLANYLIWRDKVDPDRKQEAFFLKADGKPFPSEHAMRKFLNQHVKPKHPWFHPYLGRHWCANARLVEWHHDYPRVADWLGHESVNMTRHNYEHNARLHERLWGRDWLLRISRRTDRTGKSAVSARPTGEK